MSISMARFVAYFALPFSASLPPLVERLANSLLRKRGIARLDLDQAPEGLLRDLGILDGRGDVHPREGHRRGR